MTVKGTGIYIPEREAEILGYYENAVTVLATLAVKYGISAATLTALQTHNANLKTTLNKAIADAMAAQDSTQIKHDEFAQAKIDLLNVFQQIQKAANFYEGDAEALGFRVITIPVDLDTVKPVISGITIVKNHVIIDWIKGELDGVSVYSSYNGVDFTEIGRDTRSPYYDARKNQTNQPEVRHYKLTYLKGDDEVGLESDVAKVVVQIF